MHRSSESIGAIAAALAKAQAELVNPEKSLTGTITTPRSGRRRSEPSAMRRCRVGSRSCARAWASMRSPRCRRPPSTAKRGSMRLTTVLAHSSGEWISSEWPVCPVSETANPRRMGAALTYARRYALFTLVGIAGEDDLDAPDLNAPTGRDAAGHASDHGAARPMATKEVSRRIGRTVQSIQSSLLAPAASAALRDQLLGEIGGMVSAEAAAMWARQTLKAKNTMTAEDAVLLESAFQAKIAAIENDEQRAAAAPASPAVPRKARTQQPPVSDSAELASKGIDKSVLTFPEPRRLRDKAHLRHVAKQPCLICGRQPADAHHIRFAQPRALGRKVSDEFAVPLCRGHHRENHQHGDEAAWWANAGVDAPAAARRLWMETHPGHCRGTT